MKDFEKVENNVDVKAIRSKLLNALHLGPGELATALGINYQRIYDLGSGRTKKFNPGMVNLIISKFPQVNPTFLYTGEGEPLLTEEQPQQQGGDLRQIISMSKQVMEMIERLNNRTDYLDKRAADLDQRQLRLEVRERELYDRERDLIRRESLLAENKEKSQKPTI